MSEKSVIFSISIVADWNIDADLGFCCFMPHVRLIYLSCFSIRNKYTWSFSQQKFSLDKTKTKTQIQFARCFLINFNNNLRNRIYFVFFSFTRGYQKQI